MISAVDVAEDILKFRGFWKSSFKDKLIWIFVLYPFMLFVVSLFTLQMACTYIYCGLHSLKRKMRRKK